MTSNSKLVMTLLPSTSTINLPLPTTQIRHPHNLDYQTRPARKMLRSLSLSSFWIILLPGETRFDPLVVDGFDQVDAQVAV
jgi:hypothetical protein